jgi:soluble lytic murein transglycosylase-like protein/TolA-binding protein
MRLILKSVSTTLLFFLLSSSFALAQPASDSQQLIRSAVENSDWPTALAELNKLRGLDPAAYQAKGYDYLAARIAEKTGDTAAAVSGYQDVVRSNQQLAPYSLWHLASIARANGDLVHEREQLRKLVTTAPKSSLFNAAALRLARSFLESGDYAGAADSARQITSASTVPLAREASAIMAQSYVKMSKETEARDLFTKLIMQMPDASRPDDFALTAARELDSLDRKTPTQKLSEADHLLRASIYQFNRDFAGARTHYQAVIDDNPQNPTVPNAMYQLARGLYLESRYNEALALFQKVVDQFPESPSARDAMGYVASTNLRMKRTEDGINAYKQFIARYPDAPNPERAYLNLIDALHEAGRHPEALNWVQQARARFKNDLGGTLALFSQMRIHVAQGDWNASVLDADELLKASDLGGARVPGGTSTAEVNFLRAYALEQVGRINEAINAYLAIPDGRNEYYGVRATRRLLDLAANQKSQQAIQAKLNSLLANAKSAGTSGQFEVARSALQSALRLTSDANMRADLLKDLRVAYASLPAYKLPVFTLEPLVIQNAGAANDHRQLAELLASLALYDEAIPELLTANAVSVSTAPKTATPNNTAYTLAYYSLRGGLANRAVRFGEPLWRSVPGDFLIELAPRDLVELLYPAPYREVLLKHSTSRNVDPRFVLSIARQESRYQTDAKSVAAARGMMQFIAATANDVAAQLKLTNFNQDDLYDAGTAILFGSQYLASLFQQFPDQPDAVAAAYNGGADNMGRWQARSRSKEPDRYVAEIGYAQSKDYVYRVMTNFWNYQRLYDSELRSLAGATK